MIRIKESPITIAASQTLAPILAFSITPDQQTSLRVDIYLGKVAGTGDIILQDTSAFGIWNTIKTVTVAPSTDKSVSGVSTAANTLTITAHGYVEDQAIVLNSSATTPGGVDAGRAYLVHVVDANTIQLKTSPSNIVIDITTAGSGTITASAVTLVSIPVQAVDASDQAFTPVRRSVRLVATTDVAETIQVVHIKHNA